VDGQTAHGPKYLSVGMMRLRYEFKSGKPDFPLSILNPIGVDIMRGREKAFCVFFAALATVFLATASQAAPVKTLGDRIGAAHAAGNYYFTSKPFLIEGAEAIRAMGSKVIKVFLDPSKYPYNSQWANCPNLVDVLSTQYFKDIFSMDFEKYVLQAHWNTADKSDWIDGVDLQEKEEIEKNYYDAAKYLLSAYSGTSKKFFLEHWEADWFVNGTPPEFNRLKHLSESQKQIAYRGFLDYLAARHRGVEKAKKEITNSSAKVFSAVEIACISKYPEIFRLIDHMDEVKADYISYSMYECGTSIPLLFDNIRALKSKLNGRPFYIGETMRPEKEYAAYPNLHAPS
jgi:hypothetical protein